MDGGCDFVYAAVLSSTNNRGGPRGAPIDRRQQKEMWSLGYRTWNDEQFKSRVRVNRATFDFILEEINPSIEKTPTNLQPDPIESHRQLEFDTVPAGPWMRFPSN